MAYYLTYGDNTLFDPYTTDTIYDAKLTCKSNTADYLDFTVPYGHTYYDSVVERGYTVTLKWDDTVLFYGEVESIDTDFEGNKAVSCVGGLDWLNSTVVRPYSTVAGEAALTAPTAVNALFEWYIEQHNEHIKDSRKGFAIGVNEGNLLDENNYVYRSSTSYPATWDEINDKIIDELGGYVTVTYNPLTINLYADIHSTNSQVIDFGVNLLDFTKNVATDSQATAVLPTGAQLYFHVKYSDTTSPASSDDISDTPKTYIGTYVDSNSGDETDDFSVYAWQRYSSCRGSSGADGILGTLSDSTKLYLHVAYATSSDGSSGFSKTDANNKSYLGQYVDYTLEGSDKYTAYSWEEYSPVTYDEEGKEDTSGSGVHCPNSHDGPVVMIDNLPDGVTSYSSDFVKSGDVVYSQAGVNRYGYIEYQYSNDDITLPKNMLTKACQALNNLISPVTTIDISAVDLALYMDGYDHLEVGQAVRIRSNFHNTDEYLMVESIDLDLLDPSSTSYTLGGEYDTLTGQQNKYLKNLNSNLNKSLDSVAALTDDVKNSAKEIEAAQGAAASAEKAASDAKDTAAEAEKAASEASGAVAAAVIKYDKAIEDLQKQVDGSIETWFYGEVPTLTNEPAKDWSTDEDKNKHLGDLYYDTSTGYCYRWQNQNGIYSWSRITDTDVTKALEAAKNAQDTADHKRTIFVDIPTVPYEIGDLWVQGDSGDILRCMTARKSTEAYSASDWEVASKYTDDSKANQVQSNLDETNNKVSEVETTANDAKEVADTANATATEASSTANAASLVASDAKTTASNAETAANTATTTANMASTAASEAKTAATNAQTTASEASDTATAAKEAADKAVISTVVEYAQSDSSATAPTSGWSTDAPAFTDGKYIWMHQIVTYGSGETSITSAVVITGNTGKGVKGDSAYIHIAYANSEDGKTDFSVDDPVGKSYIGQYSDDVEEDSTDPTKYSWTKIKGDTGAQGPQGETGAQGSRGTGILKITTAPTAYTTKVDTFTPSYRILLSTVKSQSGVSSVLVGDVLQYSYWQYKVGYVNASYVYTAAASSIRGATGATGTDGASVTAVKLQYAICDSSTTAPTSSWQDSVPDWQTGKYIWQRSVTTITDASGTATTQYGDAVLYGAFTSLAKSVDGNSSKITQTADALGVTFDSSGNATSTLIRETSDGIEVGKSEDGGTYTGTHTLVGTDEFIIHDKDHNELASFGSDTIKLGENSESARVEFINGKVYMKADGTSIYLMGTDIGISGRTSTGAFGSAVKSYGKTVMVDAPDAIYFRGGKQVVFWESSLKTSTDTSMEAIALVTQPHSWMFSDRAVEGWATWDMSAGTNRNAVQFNTNLSGKTNWSSYFGVSNGTMTTKVQGTWRIRFQMTFTYCNSDVAIYVTCGSVRRAHAAHAKDTTNSGGFTLVAECVVTCDSGSQFNFYEYGGGSYTKQLAGCASNTIVEYCGMG